MSKPKENILSSFVELWSAISDRRKYQGKLILILMLISSIVEVFSIGLVLPFLTSLLHPEEFVSTLSVYLPELDFSDFTPSELRFYLLIVFLVMTVFSGFVRYILLYTQIKFGHAVGADLSRKVFSCKLHLPYKYHAKTSSSKLISDIKRSDDVVGQILFPFLFFISSLTMIIFMVSFLLFINPFITIASILFFTTIYFLILILTRGRISKIGKVMNDNITKRMKVLQEGFGSVRDIIIDRSQNYFEDSFSKADLSYRNSAALIQIYSSAPRYAVETFGMIFIAFFAYILVRESTSFIDELPIFGVMALAAQRLLPLAQQLYASLTNMRAFRVVLNDVIESLNCKNRVFYPNSKRLEYRDSVKINQVSFRYGTNDDWLFNDVNFVIPKGSCVGLIGESGSGKSTFVDILMGLIEPTKGHIEIDGKKITTNNVSSWWTMMAHVPQSSYLLDDSILENIILGSSTEKSISDAYTSAENAELGSLLNSLDNGIHTEVGERGALLSGGQCQRISIARALYKNPKLLILDEATSALDVKTEKRVIDNIFSFNENMTIFMVTHRLSSLSRCDFVINIENGKMINMGVYSK
jgi:ATP-binding cassette, subfamily B, bacterial PglK